jgi:hypothetical protein
MADPVVRRRYSIVVGLEFGLLGAGAAVLGATGQDRWIPAWICAGVGVHFFPLASTLANRSLRLLGVLLIAVAAAALVTLLAGRPLYGDPSDGLRLPRSQPEGKA